MATNMSQAPPVSDSLHLKQKLIWSKIDWQNLYTECCNVAFTYMACFCVPGVLKMLTILTQPVSFVFGCFIYRQGIHLAATVCPTFLYLSYIMATMKQPILVAFWIMWDGIYLGLSHLIWYEFYNSTSFHIPNHWIHELLTTIEGSSTWWCLNDGFTEYGVTTKSQFTLVPQWWFHRGGGGGGRGVGGGGGGGGGSSPKLNFNHSISHTLSDSRI